MKTEIMAKPIKIDRQLSFSDIAILFKKKVSIRDWITFTKKLSLMLNTGVPLLKSLEIISANQSSRTLRDNWLGIKDRIAKGYQLSEVLKNIKPEPPLFLISMVSAGEHTGSLARSLERAAEELEKAETFKRKIIGTVTYPLLLLLAVIAVFFSLRNWVLPVYEKLYTGFNAELPFLSKAVFICRAVAISAFFRAVSVLEPYLGTAIAANTDRIMTTIMISTRVKPAVRL